MANWKSPGPDQIHAYWLKKLTSTHDSLAKFLDKTVNGGEQVPKWLPHGTTHLLMKDPQKSSNDPSNYRPITCLPTMWKLLTAILASEVTKHLNKHTIIAQEQKGCSRGTRGTKD